MIEINTSKLYGLLLYSWLKYMFDNISPLLSTF